jgi:hypothetical protein
LLLFDHHNMEIKNPPAAAAPKCPVARWTVLALTSVTMSQPRPTIRT